MDEARGRGRVVEVRRTVVEDVVEEPGAGRAEGPDADLQQREPGEGPAGESRADNRPPASLPRPSPAMNAATMSVMEYTDAPLPSASIRCHATW